MKNIIKKLNYFNRKLKNIEIYSAIFKGMDVWFTDERVKLPKNSALYKYEIRYDDNSYGDPVELTIKVLANFYGTIISNHPIDLPITGLNTLQYDDISIGSGDFYIDYSKKSNVYDLIIKTNKEKKWI